MKAYVYAFPKLGRNREYKKVIEDYRALVQMIVSQLSSVIASEAWQSHAHL
jgi:predicted AlkP superfamily phosphohydrolase/phosphomutase